MGEPATSSETCQTVNLLLPMTIAGLLITGMGIALLGSVKLSLARRLQIDEARVGGLVSLFGFTMIPVILTAGFLTDLLGRQWMFIGGVILMSIGLVVLSVSRQYGMALVGVLLLSAAWSMQINVINVVTPPAFLKPSEIPERIAFATNLGNVFFGVGAFLTPLLAAVSLRRIGFTPTLLVLAGIALVPAVMAGGVDFAAIVSGGGDPLQNADAATATTATLLSDRVMWLCAMALFFYGPLEASMAAWTTTYLGEQGVAEETASSMLSMFWLSFMASRLVTAFWISRWASSLVSQFALPTSGEAVLILLLAVACVAVLSGVVWSRSRSSAMAMVVAAGLVFGPIFPSIMAILLGHFEPAVQGRAVGFLFAIGGLGWTTIPMLIGNYAKRTSVQRGFLVAIASALGLCLIAVALVGFASSP